ncbi:MAG: heme o synthase [Haloarculaceae archaeon]
MYPGNRRPRFVTLLAAAAMGVYLLIVLGATQAIADAARACRAWPLCARPPSLSSPALAVAWGHRLVAALVGVLVVWAVVAGFRRSDASKRVRAALGVAAVLYPIQVAFGALLSLEGATGALPTAHLLAGMAIFGALTVALAWHLELTTGGSSAGDARSDAPPPPVGEKPTAAADATTAEKPTVAAATAVGPLDRVRRVVGAYVQLMKPRLMWLLCLVASAGMALAAGPDLSVRTVVLTLSGGVLSIGASGTFNHVFEREKDKRMARTNDRPVATHEVPARNAAVFGIALAAISVGVFLLINPLAAALGLSAILFYSVIYTLVLKPNTVQNTVIGGAAGALPALIGWAAVTGTIGLPGLALAGVIFVWTPAHFYNLALAYKDDYAAGGFPMMPVVRGETTTRKHIVLWLALTLLSATALAWVTDLGWLYAATTTALGAVFLWTVIRLHREQTESAAFRAFHASNAYLGALLLAVVVDALVL